MGLTSKADALDPACFPRVTLFFLPRLGGGGAEMNAVRLAGALLDHGVTPIYAVARGPGSYAEFLPAGVEVIVLETGRINSSTLRLLHSVGPLRRLIDARRPDVLCPVLPLTAGAALAAVRRSRHKPAVVLSVQNTLDAPSTANRLMAQVQGLVVDRLFPRADRIIALSEGVAGDIARRMPALADRTDVVFNVGLPLPSQLGAATECDGRGQGAGRLLLACGRLTEQKGYVHLLRAFATFAAADDVRLHILGDGPLRGELEALARTLGIAERVSFLGFQRDPYVHMRRADVFVLSSLWEGFGNVIVEAMAMGTPVVATSCPHGPAEIITDGESGLLVPPADEPALAAALRRLIHDRTLRAKLAANGLKRAQDFSAAVVGARYAAIFRAVAGQVGGKLR